MPKSSIFADGPDQNNLKSSFVDDTLNILTQKDVDMSKDAETNETSEPNIFESTTFEANEADSVVSFSSQNFQTPARFEPFYDFTDQEGGEISDIGDSDHSDSAFDGHALYQDFECDETPAYNQTLSWCCDALKSSPTALSMMDIALKEGWSVELADLDEGSADFEIDIDTQAIILNNNGLSDDAILRSGYFKTIVLTAFVRALRQIWQDKRHDDVDISLKPEDILMSQRIRTADLDIVMVCVAWELRAAAQDDDQNMPQGQVWRHMIGSEDGDLALAFSQSFERGQIFSHDQKHNASRGYTTLTNAAMMAAFYQWFRSEERVNAADHSALRAIDAVLLDGDVQTLPAEDKGQRALTGGQVELLSCLPNKTAYLMGFGAEILSDPHFSGLYDGVNQAHLMHIAYDMKVVHRGNVAFQSSDLASKIFPES